MADIVKFQQATDRRIAIFKSEEVQEGMNRTEVMIMEAGINNARITDMTDQDLTKDLGIKAKFIAKDVGIKGEIEAYQAARFFDIARKYYYKLTTNEIKLAFELAMTGELDPYLPKDRNGEPDKNHYQEFSIEYITKILNGYRKKQSETWHKAKVLLPVHENTPTENEIEIIMMSGIVESFEIYKDTGILNDYGSPKFDWLYTHNIIVLEDEQVKQYLSEAREKVKEGVMSKEKSIYHSDRQEFKKDIEELLLMKDEHSKIQAEAKYMALITWYEELIENETDIKTLIYK